MATLNLQVGASADDADQETSTVTINRTTLPIYWSDYWLGARFQNVTIPSGSTINSATLSVYVVGTSYDTPHFDVYGEDADSAAAFAATNDNISNRTRTTAKADWDGTDIGTGWKDAPDLTTAIQEIIDRGGWSSGNDLALILDAMTDAEFECYAWDHDDHTYAPKLDIDYTPPAGGGAAVQMDHHRRRRV